MQSAQLLHDFFAKACLSIDKRITHTLFQASEALTRSKNLSLTILGRTLDREAQVKNKIKCMDRLFGNEVLHSKRNIYYQAVINLLLDDNLRPVIIIDWSGLTPCGAYHFLRASIVSQGRAITLLEKAFPLKEVFKLKTHQDFLDNLKKIIPKNCKPIVVTDAGFRNSWFRYIEKLQWDYVGRVRNNTKYFSESMPWQSIKTIYDTATSKPSYKGKVLLAQHNPLVCHFYLIKQPKKYRVKRNLVGKKVRCSSSLKHEVRENEPWLIASSIDQREMSALAIINLYKKRMQIEESFRDLKNMRNGLGLRHCRSFKVERLDVALLIAALATLILWILGLAAKLKDLHVSFQSNTEKRRAVLSIFYIGWQVLINKSRFKKKEIKAAIKLMVASTRHEFH